MARFKLAVNNKLHESAALQTSCAVPARLAICLFAILCVGLSSCASLSIDTARRAAYVASWHDKNSIGTRAVKRTNQLGPIKRLLAKAPSPSKRTQQLLRQNVLDIEYKRDTDSAILKLQALAADRPSLDTVHAVAELAFQQADWAKRMGHQERAMKMYTTAIISAHQFLFDPDLDLARNAYDPQFRSISDIYNQSLEAVLRNLIKKDELRPGNRIEISSINRTIVFTISVEGRWKNEDIEKFEIVSDFEPQGLTNHYHTFGLGVPLIGVRKQGTDQEKLEKHYPPGLTMALTAFLDVSGSLPIPEKNSGPSATLVLFDPLEQNIVQMDDRYVPLESDISTPMAYYLDDPLLHTNVLATFALLNADFAKQYQGIYMLEPYDPNKIPVVMVHGLWSSPVTWLQMFNDLRADRDIRENYQFWFCLYPTGQPFWESARQVRQDLDELESELIEQFPSNPPKDMVLVGHSMGGLVSRMLTVHSRSHFWNVISDHPLESFEGDPEILQRIRSTFFFDPDPRIKRVITIGTPHRGSEFATDAVQWVSEKAITLPKVLSNEYSKVAKQNSKLLKDEKPLIVATSIDSLSPRNPLFNAMLTAEAGKGVEYHNIVGRLSKQPLINRLTKTPPGDGIVSLESSKVSYALSEIEVDAEHSLIHQDPRTIFEIKRILKEDLRSRKPEGAVANVIDPLQPMVLVR